MNFKIYWFLLLLLPLIGNTQVNTDSLESVWKDMFASDLDRLDAQRELLAPRISELESPEAKELQEYYKLALLTKNPTHTAVALQSKATVNFYQGNFKDSYALFQQSMEHAYQTENKRLHLNGINGMAIAALKQGDYEKSAEHFLECWDIAKYETNVRNKINVLNNLCMLYKQLGQFQEAQSYIQKALILSRNEGYDAMVAHSHENIAAVHVDLEEYEAAVLHYDSAYFLAEQFEDRSFLAELTLGKALMFEKRENCDTAKYYFQKALEVDTIGYNGTLHFKALFGIARCSEGIDRIILAEDALIKAQKGNVVPEVQRISDFLYLELKGAGREQEAFKMLELNKLATSALSDSKALKRLAEFEFETEKERLRNESQAKLEEEQKTRQRMISIILLIAGLIVIAVLVFFVTRSRSTKKEKNALLSQIDELKEKLSNSTSPKIKLGQKITINQSAIELAAEGPLNESDWKIIEVLVNEPSISNTDLADKVALSVEGARSSLKKMYRLFAIPSSKNKRLTLVMKLIHITEQASQA